MESNSPTNEGSGALTSRIFRRLLTIGENRMALLGEELREGRERAVRLLLLVFGVGVFGLLFCMALSAAVVASLWPYSPVGALSVVAGGHGLVCAVLSRKCRQALAGWKTLPDSREQLRRDRDCLERILA